MVIEAADNDEQKVKQEGRWVKRSFCDVISPSTPETCGLLLNMKLSKWISLEYNCTTLFIA